MTKTLTIAAALLIAAFASSALAAPPADRDACNKLAFDLAEKVAAKKLPEDQALKVEEMLGMLEGQCSGGTFAEADATAKKVEAAIAK